MLVVSRKLGEKILIGDSISITVARIGPSTVRLGIDAPKDMKIVRDELLRRIGVSEDAINNVPDSGTVEIEVSAVPQSGDTSQG